MEMCRRVQYNFGCVLYMEEGNSEFYPICTNDNKRLGGGSQHMPGCEFFPFLFFKEKISFSHVLPLSDELTRVRGSKWA